MPAGTTVHYHGIPFRLAEPARLEGHPANVAYVGMDHDDYPAWVRNPELLRRPSIFQRIRQWWGR